MSAGLAALKDGSPSHTQPQFSPTDGADNISECHGTRPTQRYSGRADTHSATLPTLPLVNATKTGTAGGWRRSAHFPQRRLNLIVDTMSSLLRVCSCCAERERWLIRCASSVGAGQLHVGYGADGVTGRDRWHRSQNSMIVGLKFRLMCWPYQWQVNQLRRAENTRRDHGPAAA